MGEALTLELPADVSAPKMARRALALWGANAEADVVVSELVTNAVLHGSAPISLIAIRTAEWIHIEVRDERPDLGSPGPNSVGLRLVEAFSLDWGVTRLKGDGKIVWAEFAA
jgi:anti-sigma regulatory factor (Ser/Thr protein kinase)